MVDQRRARGVLVPFFSEPAWTNTGLFYLWKQRPAPIIPITIRRLGLNHHEIEFHEEFVVATNEPWSFDEFVLENTKRMNRCVEALILANPLEYFWMHDRWKK
jgi:KDO2-lipid IV(A) lauroyltransferase